MEGTNGTAQFRRQIDRTSFYPHPGAPQTVDVSEPRHCRQLRIAEATFTSTLPSGDARNDKVRARLLWPASGCHGQLVVFLNGLGLSRLSGWDSLAGSLARRGFRVVLLGLPFTCERTPDWMRPGSPYMSTDGDVSLPAYEQAVADVRGVLDWALEERPFGCEKETPPPAVLGVSLGALVAVIAAALEPRFGALVSVLGGADLDIIVFRGAYRTTVPAELRRRGIGIESRRLARRRYQSYLERVREASHPLDVPPDYHFFLFDPLTFANHLRERPALLINALYDPIIPREATLQLWRELGSPELLWLTGTHWPGGPWKPLVSRAAARFLRGAATSRRRVPEPSAATAWMP